MQMSGADQWCHAPNPETGLAGHSRFYQRLHRRYESEFALLPAGTPVLATIESAYDALRAQGYDTGSALRVLRQLVLERLIRRDCESLAPLADITRAMTEMAEFALDRACCHARAELDERHGAPRIVMLSLHEYRRLRALEPRAFHPSELNDEDYAALGRSREKLATRTGVGA